ncbi:hypothetical protein WMF27_32630 [Sorangium sp. So ce281]|uniref:hypothetical protein n=1 Tax=unclassified Sorangium TaxID=2621164 RepID=UPI003F5E23FE
MAGVGRFDATHRPILGLLGKAVGITPGTLGFSLGTKEQIDAAKDGWRPLAARIDSLESYVKALTSFVLDTSTLLHLDRAGTPVRRASRHRGWRAR